MCRINSLNFSVGSCVSAEAKSKSTPVRRVESLCGFVILWLHFLHLEDSTSSFKLQIFALVDRQLTTCSTPLTVSYPQRYPENGR